MTTSPASSPILSVPISVLDVAPVPRGTSSAEALASALAYADAADRLGFHRIWYAEHHNMPGIASSAPEVLIATVAARTSRIRVGSGGVMLPNHAPLMVAERFGTLEELHPGRIDLGIGRAPGSDQRTMWALRRETGLRGQDLPELLDELFGYFEGFPDDHPMHGLRATPGYGHMPELWLLGSSGSSAQLAAHRGLPFATAHHFSPAATVPSMRMYREHYQPSERYPTPQGLVTVQVVVADTEQQARSIADAFALMFLRMRQGHPPDKMLNAEDIAAHPWTDDERAFADQLIAGQAVGTPEQVIARLAELISDTGATEIMATTMAPEPADRMRSLELLAAAASLQAVA
ncbi:MAG: LLM class flavin-dependent oxidoreductase [Gaiellales bacterium]